MSLLVEFVLQIALEKAGVESCRNYTQSVAKSKFEKCAELNELYVDPPELLELFLNFSYQLL